MFEKKNNELMIGLSYHFLLRFGFNSSCFAVVGKTGVGKSSLINALANKKCCKTGSGGKSITLEEQCVNFVHNEHLFNVIDTAGLDDNDENINKQRIESLKSLLSNYPKIKKIVIVKPYDEMRLSDSLNESLCIFMDSFPLKNFWEHTIVVNTFADTLSRGFTNFFNKKYIPLYQKIKENKRLIEHMEKHNIDPPDKIKEYFLEPELYMEFPKEYNSMRMDLEEILKDIKDSKMMYKDVSVGPEQVKILDSKINLKGFFVERTFRIIKCTDFDDKITQVEHILNEREIAPCDPIRTQTVTKIGYKKDVEWYDVLTIGISWLIRDTTLYKEYLIKYYEVKDEKGNKHIIEGQEVFQREYWK